MKKIVFMLISLSIAFLISSCKKEKQPEINTYVYTFETPAAITTDQSKDLIGKFLGVHDVGSLYRSDDNIVYYVGKDDVSETFEQDLNTGNFTYNKSMKKYMGSFVPKLPSQQDAVGLAKTFLSDNKLLPKNPDELRMIHFGGLRAATVVGGKKAGPVIDEMVTVNFARVVDEMPVIGPGSKIVVNLGDHGEVMGQIHRWRELNAGSKQSVRQEELVSQQQAEEMAKRQIIAEYGPNSSYKILGSHKAYYDNNGKILQPVYMFETTVNVESKDQMVKPFDYLCVIPMLKNSPEPLNLTYVDPRARETIKGISRGEKIPKQAGDRAKND